jgi:hypothetical protein
MLVNRGPRYSTINIMNINIMKINTNTVPLGGVRGQRCIHTAYLRSP